MTPQELQIAVEAIIDAAALAVESGLTKAQRDAFAEVVELLADLSTTGGNIRPSVANLRKSRNLNARLIQALKESNWEQVVAAATAAVEEIATLLEAYTAEAFSAAQFPAIIQAAVASIESTLGLTSLGGQVGTLMSKAVNDAIAGGLSVRDLVRTIQDQIEAAALLNVSRVNIKQVVTDALGQFQAAWLKESANRTGAEWFRYVGGTIDSTRDFCRARTSKYFHKTEIEDWAALDWKGKIEGTNSRSIFLLRGGWNCRHAIVPVHERVVPDSVRDRVGR